MIRLILFDIDGTLIATGGAGLKAFDLAFELLHGKRNAASGLDFAGRTDSAIIQELFGNEGVHHTEEAEENFYACYLQLLDRFLSWDRGRTLPGAHETLSRLQSLPDRPMLGLLTGNVILGAELKLRHHNLWHGFEMGAFGCEDPMRNQLAANAKARSERILGQRLDGEEILVIGDTPRDVECARSIGAKVVAVKTGASSVESLEKASPDLLIDDLESIEADALIRI